MKFDISVLEHIKKDNIIIILQNNYQVTNSSFVQDIFLFKISHTVVLISS